MQIKKAEVENFRKLKNVTIDLDDSVTLIVGRNNSGKTSLSEVFNKFLGPNNPGFTFDDFSFSVLSDYNNGIASILNFSKLQKYASNMHQTQETAQNSFIHYAI